MTFTPKVIKALKIFDSLSVGVSAENLLVITKYPGYDPEVGAFNADSGQSIDFYAYPRPTTITGTIKVVF